MAQGSGSLRALIFLALAIVLGSGAVLVLFQLISSYQERIDEARKPEDVVMVIVAARDLSQGVVITEEDLYYMPLPPRYLPEGVFLSVDHVVGRLPRERILENEFIRADRLADPENGIGLNAVIPRGMRAISININGGAALQGLLNPGNYVDLLVTITPEEGKGRPETRTILQSLFVLGVGTRTQRTTPVADTDGKGKKGEAPKANVPSVTLMVTAEQAEAIAHAQNKGALRLALRTDRDRGYVEQIAGVDVDTLMGRLRIDNTPRVKSTRTAPKAAAAAEPENTIIMIRGDRREEKAVDGAGSLKR